MKKRLQDALPPEWVSIGMWSVGVFAYVLAITNRTSLSAVGVDTAELFRADASTLSMFGVLQLAVYGLMQIPVGLLLDRFGARSVITIGMLVMGVGQLVIAFAPPNIGLAIFARMLLGAGDAAIFPSVLRVIAVWFSAQRAPVFVQMTGITGALGQFIALLPLASLLRQTSWSIAFGTLAGLGLLFAVLVFSVIRNRPATLEEDVSINTDTGAIRVVKSSFDLRQSLADAWKSPGTRLGFWSHFTTPFAASGFMLLWGMPFLTAGEGLPIATANLVMGAMIVFGILTGPVIGMLSSRHPMRRSTMLVLPSVAFQAVTWIAVLLWPGRAPLWLLLLLMLALAMGGPASMIAFDHARRTNPRHRLSTATGMVNGAGFFSALTTMFLIGVLLDVQGANEPAKYTMEAFRIAFLAPIPLWVLGVIMILRERRAMGRHLGVFPPKQEKPKR